MCTSIVSNRKKTIIGFNLDIGIKEHKVFAEDDKVYIGISDEVFGWLPLFGANCKGGFVGMPTCWPHDSRSNPKSENDKHIMNVDIDYLFMKKSFEETKEIAMKERICSNPGYTWMSQISDKDGNVLQIISGQGVIYKERPMYSILANYSPIKGTLEKHDWMGLERYDRAEKVLRAGDENFDVADMFVALKASSQHVCPTVISMVFDVAANIVYWVEDRQWNDIHEAKMLH